MFWALQVVGEQEFEPHMLGPAPPQVRPMPHIPQSTVPPQPSGMLPHMPILQVAFVHGGVTHFAGAPWQIWPAGHMPQSCCPPQPSVAGPQVWAPQPILVQVGGGTTIGLMHDVRSNSMYASTFYCAVNVELTHSFGKFVVEVLVSPDTWKSEKITRPHCLAWLNGVLNA